MNDANDDCDPRDAMEGSAIASLTSAVNDLRAMGYDRAALVAMLDQIATEHEAERAARIANPTPGEEPPF